MKAMTAAPSKKAGRARNGATSFRRKIAARPKPALDFDSPEFTEALTRHIHAAKRVALGRSRKQGSLVRR